ncbi:MAG TPA: PEGA domain-containing protein [Anaeromyxobacter sp.]
MTRRIAAALVLAALAAALPARPDDVAEAKSRFKKGVELFRTRHFRDAAAEFEAAYRLKPHGAIQFNLAQCRERLEEWPGALRSYEDYLREVPDAKDRAAVRAAMHRVEERLAAAGVQVLLVYTDPPGATVSLDARERGKTPLHAVLAPGTYALALALEGHEPIAESIELSGGASRLVDVVLRPIARAATAASPPPPSAPDLAARPAASPSGPPPAPPPPGRPRRHLAAWIAAGTAVAAVTAGALLGSSARSDARAIDALPAPDAAAASRRARDAEAKARTANALYAVAGGAAATGVTLFALEARF